MSLSRRDFLRYGVAAASTAVASGGIDLSPVEAAATSLRIKEAKAFPGVCPYCAVGCAQLIYVKDGKIVDIEGDPDAPHTEGALCPKGSSTYQLSLNERRITRCLYRAPGATAWEEKPLDWMMSEIAQRVKKSRDATFVEKVKVGGNEVPVNRCEGVAWLGSSVLDNEENYLIAKLARGLGLVNLENSARLCHSATVPALGATFGRGAMTTNLIDVQHADVIMPTSNWAECHPVSYKWVMKAKERGAKIIHVDPRFTRTSATADIWVPIRSGTNIVFFGGLIRYAIESKKYFHDYVVAYTNASLLLDPQLKTATASYALQLNQSTNGVQQIRALCMLQLILGNVGRPGGGVVALRGHSNVQGATDFGTLYHMLPGYPAEPLQGPHPTLTDYLEKTTPKGGYWVNNPKFVVSLLKAWWGPAATKENDYAY